MGAESKTIFTALREYRGVSWRYVYVYIRRLEKLNKTLPCMVARLPEAVKFLKTFHFINNRITVHDSHSLVHRALDQTLFT